MSQTIAQGKATVSCQQCRIVDYGRYDEDYRIAFCSLHAAAPELMALLKEVVNTLDVYAGDIDEAGYPARADAARDTREWGREPRRNGG